MTENTFPLYGLEDSPKNTFPLDRKQLSLEGVSEEWEKISFTNQKISFHKQELLAPNFKTFNKVLNNKILFPFPLAGMKNSLKKHFQLTVKLFSQPGISDKWKKLFFTSQKNSFYQEQRSFSLKIGLHVWIMVSIRKNQIF